MRYQLQFEYPTTQNTGRTTTLFIFDFSMINANHLGKPDEERHFSYHSMNVEVSWPLIVAWRKQILNDQEDHQLKKVFFEYPRRYLEEKIKSMSDLQDLNLKLSFDNCPNILDIDPKLVDFKEDMRLIIEIPNVDNIDK